MRDRVSLSWSQFFWTLLHHIRARWPVRSGIVVVVAAVVCVCVYLFGISRAESMANRAEDNKRSGRRTQKKLGLVLTVHLPGEAILGTKNKEKKTRSEPTATRRQSSRRLSYLNGIFSAAAAAACQSRCLVAWRLLVYDYCIRVCFKDEYFFVACCCVCWWL